MVSKRSKACDITKKVKDAVWERDGHRCIVCGSPYAMPNSHYIPRSKGGLGIEENIVTMCRDCHDLYDGIARQTLMPKVRTYLKAIYPGWDERKLIYHKEGL